MFSSPSLSRLAATAALCMFPVQSLAAVVLISPLVPSRGVDEERVSDLFTLMTSELEFMEDVDEVIELDPRPPSLNVQCLDSTRCLGAITRGEEADVMLTGAIEKLGQDLVLDLLFYDGEMNRVLRRKSFTVASDPSELINAITPILVEVMTGVSPEKEKEESDMADVDFGDDLASASDDDFEEPLDFDDDEDEDLGRGTTRTYDREIEPPPPPPVEEEEEEEEEEYFDPSMISFGSTAADIQFGSSSDEISYDEPEDEPVASADSFEDEDEDDSFEDEDDYDAFEDDPMMSDPLADDEDLDLDEPAPRRSRTTSSAPPRRSTSSSTTRRSSSSNDSDYRRVHFNVRGAYTNYGSGTYVDEDQAVRFAGFHFGTLSLEAQVRVTKGLFVAAGVDGNFVLRELPPDTPLVDANGVPRRACISPPRTLPDGRVIELNCIWPIHVGVLYRFKAGIAQPYIGADAIFTQYFQNAWAAGARARLGSDFMISRHVGLNLDFALGFWQGSQWGQVDPRLPTSGFLPTVGGGLVFAL